MNIEIKILDKDLYPQLPQYATPGSAAVDLVAAERVRLEPNSKAIKMKTGLSIWIGTDNKIDVAALVLPRSGTGHKKGLVLGNSVGLIDSDYQGELLVSACNRNADRTGYEHIVINRGDRFAQLFFIPIVRPNFIEVSEFSSATERAEGGFGSTGETS